MPIIERTRQFAQEVSQLTFGLPTTHIYNPLQYAWKPHCEYLTRYGQGPKKIVFLGMNPGPWGMAQCGIPFGEIGHVQEWLGIDCQVDKPKNEHPKRLIEGGACTRSEVSGKRLWGLFRETYPNPEDFFKDHFVANYCPLVFMEASGKNRTPDKLPANESQALEALCDAYLHDLITHLQPQWIIGVGAFAEKCAQRALSGLDIQIGKILHPSPASPAANRGWAEQAIVQLKALHLWEGK